LTARTVLAVGLAKAEVRENAKYTMDEILRKHFSGERISQNLGSFFLKFLEFGFRPQKGVWGMNAGGNFLDFWRGLLKKKDY